MSTEEKIEDQQKAEMIESLSAGEFENDLKRKIEIAKDRADHPVQGIFEKKSYFDKIFPSLLIQKPGYDLYGSTTLFNFIIALFIFSFWSSISVN